MDYICTENGEHIEVLAMSDEGVVTTLFGKYKLRPYERNEVPYDGWFKRSYSPSMAERVTGVSICESTSQATQFHREIVYIGRYANIHRHTLIGPDWRVSFDGPFSNKWFLAGVGVSHG
jgi:hypothetical protein